MPHAHGSIAASNTRRPWRRRKGPEPVVELQPLEERVLFAFHAYITSPQSMSLAQGTTFSAYVHTTGGLSSSWSVDWGDGSAATPYGSSGTGLLLVSHTYTTQGSYAVKATATSTTSLHDTAVFGLSATFGVSPSQSGETVVTPFGSSGSSKGNAMAVDHNTGKIYVAGQYSTTKFALTRFLSNGSVDTAFGNQAMPGTVSFSFDTSTDTALSVAVSGDGSRVAVVGSCSTGWAVAVYDMSGQTPVLWQSTATVWPTGDGPRQAGAKATAVVWDDSDQADDPRIIIAGTDGAGQNVVVATLVQDFTNGGYIMDTNWGNQGTRGLEIVQACCMCATCAVATSLIEIPLGEQNTNPSVDKFFVGGYTTNGCCGSCCAQSNFMLLRLTPDSDDGGTGQLDTTFGNNGVVQTNLGSVLGSCASGDQIHSIVEWYDDSTGSYYIDAVGVTNQGSNNVGLARYSENTGALDTRFGTRGVVRGPAGEANAATLDGTPFQGFNTEWINNTGNLVIAGDSSGDFLTARFSNVAVQGGPAAGGLDPTFGNGGVMLTDFGTTSGNTNDFADGIVINSDGTIVTGGYSGNSIAMAGYNPTDKLIVNP